MSLNYNMSSFCEAFHKQLVDLLGGTNDTQKLSLLVPGIALEKLDFAYDYENFEEKGPTVEANESRLANKLYDPFDINGADNGQTLPHQYKSALDALTPQLNSDIVEAKNQLRELLLTNYPYKFTDGNGNIKDDPNTFQEVFYTLYNNYVKVLKLWTEKQNQKKDEIYDQEYKDTIKKYRANKDEDAIKKLNIEKNDEYLRWFETEAYSEFTQLNQTMGNLLSVFSENDMKIIEGILDSGSGGELQEARETLRNLRKITPDGAYIYPVKFNPTGWFKDLDCSFTPMDIIDDPNNLREKLGGLATMQKNLLLRCETLAKIVPTDTMVQEANKAVVSARKAFEEGFSAMETAGRDAFGGFITDTIKLAVGMYFDPSLVTIATETKKDSVSEADVKDKKDKDQRITDYLKPLLEKIIPTKKEEVEAKEKTNKSAKTEAEKQPVTANEKELSEKLKGKDAAAITGLIGDFISNITKNGAKVSAAMANMNLSTSAYLAALENIAIVNKNKSLEASVESLKQQLASVTDEMDRVKSKLDMATALIDDKVDVRTSTVPEGFSQFYLTHTNKSSSGTDSSSLSVSTEVTEAGFLCFKDRETTTESHSNALHVFNSEGNTIEIGMNVAKIGIEREWFNPGLFKLTNEMYRFTTKPVSMPFTTSGYKPGDYLFPCFPVAMLIARDVTIKQTITKQSEFSYVNDSVKEINDSGSFVFYNTSSGSKNSSSYSYFNNETSTMTIITRIPFPQVIGFYLQETPRDCSKLYKYNTDKDTTNIKKYIESYMGAINTKIKNSSNCSGPQSSIA